jgi:serine/threonine protein kinase
VLTRIQHPFIVTLHYAFQTANQLFLILEYCPGGDLSLYLKENKRFSEYAAKLYLAEIVLAIEELHTHNIIYRDLKPSNIVLDSAGHCKLTDFGLSK